MEFMSREELVGLAAHSEGPCVSLFMPAHRAVSEPKEDPLRFKNLVAAAEAILKDGGMRSSAAREILKPALDLVNDGHFWRNQGDGLAAFAAPGFFKLYLLSIGADELVDVMSRFCLRPLVTLPGGEDRFYILALSQNEVRLLEGTPFGVVEFDIAGVPASLSEVVGQRETEKHLQYHTGTPQRKGGVGRRAAIFHGHGTGRENRKEDLLKFFRDVDRGLGEFTGGGRYPMVLAGVEYLFPIFKEVNTYPYLLEEGIAGNPEEFSASELHDMAWRIVDRRFQVDRDVAIERFAEAAGTGLASDAVEQIVPAAAAGRVETLFVDARASVRGGYEADSGRVDIEKQKAAGGEDLLNLAIAETFLHGGGVFAMSGEEAFKDSPAGAIFRY